MDPSGSTRAQRFAPTNTPDRPIRTLPGGQRFRVRARTHDDLIVEEVFGKSSYHKLATFTPDDRWLDVGGHIGTFAVAMAPRVAAIHSFEPDPDNHALLAENLALNDCANVVLHHAAVTGTRERSRLLFVSPTGRTSAHSFHVHQGRVPTPVPAIHIRDALQLARPTKLKLDCEGAEAEILPAMTDLDWAPIQELVMEYHVSMLKDRDLALYFELLDILERHFHNVDGPRHHSGAWVRFVHAYAPRG
jgi:FkbM family methyltransferase